ncbi:MAG: aldehyde dehydrogenase family protein [Brachybacterium sp.]|nr:aldehyde dehydrogenase family protein [Brachybacterium sp.]
MSQHHTAPQTVPPAEVVRGLRDAFDSGVTLPVAARLQTLADLQRGLTAEAPALAAALEKDLGKGAVESVTTEIGYLHTEIAHMRKNLRRWLRPARFRPGAILAPSRGQLIRDPLGVALVIAPWNYPVNLALSPLVGAIAGGNTTVLKPSEVTPATSAAIAALVRRHLDPRVVAVVEGGVEETTELLEQRFDTIFYTGGGHVGRIVARAAAEHLTPVTLELGGKSPVFVDDGVDLEVAARRIVWGTFTNAGQTCVAPDYLMATPATLRALEPHLVAAVREFYGRDPRDSADYGRIVNEKHLERIAGLLEMEASDPSRLVLGGPDGIDSGARYIPPTIVRDVDEDHPLMSEEIFGPILPLVPVTGATEAIERIRNRPKPLTAYVFTSNPRVETLFAAHTSSGSLAIGLTLAHLGSVAMPFGGVGESGYGAYHGEHSLDAFTHTKPLVTKPLRPDTLTIVYPPAPRAVRAMAGRLLRPRD